MLFALEVNLLELLLLVEKSLLLFVSLSISPPNIFHSLSSISVGFVRSHSLLDVDLIIQEFDKILLILLLLQSRFLLLKLVYFLIILCNFIPIILLPGFHEHH